MRIDATSSKVTKQFTELATVVIDLSAAELPDTGNPTIAQIIVENDQGLYARFYISLRKISGRIQAGLMAKRHSDGDGDAPNEIKVRATADWRL